MKNILIFIMALFLVSCASQKKTATSPYSYIMWIKGVKANCTGVGTMKCLLVQKNDIIIPGKWEIFYDQIEGFEYQNRNLYKLMVAEERLDKSLVPADGSLIKYKLVEVLEKKPDPIFQLHDIWALESIKVNSLQASKINSISITPSIEINITEMKIMGTDG